MLCLWLFILYILFRLNLSELDFGITCYVIIPWYFHIKLVFISWFLQENYGLKSLNLSMNGLGDPGAAAIGVGLRVNQCLTELNISNNRITQAGAMDIAKGVATNDCLNILKVRLDLKYKV